MPFGVCVKICLTVIHDYFCVFINDGLNQCGELIAIGTIPSKILFGNRKHFYVMQAMSVFGACSRSGRQGKILIFWCSSRNVGTNRNGKIVFLFFVLQTNYKYIGAFGFCKNFRIVFIFIKKCCVYGNKPHNNDILP